MLSARVLCSAVVSAILAVGAAAVSAQTTEFSYQGSLKDGVNLANGNYDFEFGLFDALSGGTQVGLTQTRSSVAVSSGIFSVSLDFGNQYNGAGRFLEIHVRPTGGGSFNMLSPRQPIDSAPYSVKSLTADSVATGGIPAGSGNYIQNQSISPQVSADFNITGGGSASFFNAATHFNIAGNRILSNAGPGNLFAGINTGSANTTGTSNAFFGANAGQSNDVGNANSFFGTFAGSSNTSGNTNSFFGRSAGQANNAGFGNAFFGSNSGFANTASYNSFFGATAGTANTTGRDNTFLGFSAGGSSTAGDKNTTVGYVADVGSNSLTNATAIGAHARVDANNSLVLGSINGVNGANADTNVGIGTTTPLSRLDVRGNLFVGLTATPDIVASANNSIFIKNDSGDVNNSFRLDGFANNLYFIARSAPGSDAGAGFIFSTAGAGAGESVRMTIGSAGEVAINVLGVAGATSLCRNASNQIATCSSSLRYKNNIAAFNSGLNLVKQLRPITFDWKQGGMHDLGLGAEDVAKIDPLLVTYNANGEVEGIKYDRIGVVLVNAVKEQQAEIEKQQSEIGDQRSQIDALKQQINDQQSEIEAFKALVCSQNPAAEVCRQKK